VRSLRIGTRRSALATVQAEHVRALLFAQGVEAEIVARVRAGLATVEPRSLSSQVCSWTDSPDGRFVVDVLHGGRVVLACGDSGEGFKFSALMGELLADLAEGRVPDEDVAGLGLARFAPFAQAAAPRPALGR